MRRAWMCSFFFAFFLIIFSSNTLFRACAQRQIFPATANLTATWTTDNEFILQRDKFFCGFFCSNVHCTSYHFLIISNEKEYLYTDLPEEPIWSANRDHPVSYGAILNFTAAGDLVLQDADGSIVWTTNTTGKSVAGMKLNDDGNLVLFDGQNSTVWQSFDHPTDCLVKGQKLFQGQKLISSVSSTDWTTQKDSFSLQVTNEGLFAYLESNPPQVYYRYSGYRINTTNKRTYVELTSESFHFCTAPDDWDNIGIDPPFPTQYIKLMPDGHLKAFGSQASNKPVVADLLTGDGQYLGECSYPLACGRNAVCSGDKQCSCPAIDYFRAVDDRQPNMGCSHVTPLTCNIAKQHQHFIELKNILYLFLDTVDMKDVDIETCKQACLNNCSCKAAIFQYQDNSNISSGDCSLPSELFTMASVDEGVLPYSSSTFIKVQNVTSTPSPNIAPSTPSPNMPPSTPSPNMPPSDSQLPKRKNKVRTVLGSTAGSLLLLLIVVAGFTKCIIQKQKKDSEIEEEYLDQLPGLPTRFSYEELNTATQSFSKKLGEGGFGSVFQGTLEDGSQIAVKCLQGLVHIKKSFLAEVESIGSIHHVNLVRLRGFCAWKSQRLLVYEFMSKGSLDHWIYYGDRKLVLGWECRKKIILDIAKGLAYLHEECRQKIIHLDIKPQNILLDEDFNAKVSDFGLAKLIDRNQTQVISTMRGTPGYMAPECVSSIITEKMDVYSFGIVLLEILCGRKNFDRSQPEESWHLLYVFQSSWEQGTLFDIVDRYSEDMQVHGTEVMEMMKVASWCLQAEYTKRPSMSSVVKVLEGVTSIGSNLDYNFLHSKLQNMTDEHEKSSKPVLPDILSGPRLGSGRLTDIRLTLD